jgi:hypothetical protein
VGYNLQSASRIVQTSKINIKELIQVKTITAQIAPVETASRQIKYLFK